MGNSKFMIAIRPAATSASTRNLTFLLSFTLTLFVSAGLLFLVQPMIAKMVLPLLGGVPSVWNTCMVFFQAALLAGYAYAHLGPTWLGIRRHTLVHLVLLLLPFVVLPIRVSGWTPSAEGSPVVWLLLLLLVSVGLPFFVVASSAPLLQKWFASTDHPAAKDPYFLYGASNLGSLLALLAYPLLLEPHLRLANQSRIWMVGYGLLVLLTAGCAWLVWQHHYDPAPPHFGPQETLSQKAPAWLQRCRWVALAFVPSSLMLGVTTYLTTDIASVPLLWIIPLALYLITFIIVFSRVPPLLHTIMVLLLPAVIGLLAAVQFFGIRLEMDEAIQLHLVAFFIAAMVCHGELARTRPAARYLTEFYFWMALGGMLGGLFNALVAPLVFHQIVEYPSVIVLACLLRPKTGMARSGAGEMPRSDKGRDAGLMTTRRKEKPKKKVTASTSRYGFLQTRWLPMNVTVAWLLLGLAAGALFYQLSSSGDPTSQIHRARNFFGVLKVRYDARFFQLVHGTTLHGMQSAEPARRQEALSYYHRTGPIGQVFATLSGRQQRTNVAAIGLGVGTLASYARPGEEWTFYEINPEVEHVARDMSYFSYLRDAEKRGAHVQVILGDGRMKLQQAKDHRDIIVLDAFSSDSVPLHLLTREAIQAYLDHLDEHGVLAFNVSTKFLDLAPVMADLARDAKLCCYYQEDYVDPAQIEKGKQPSKWAVMMRRPEDLGHLAQDLRWKRLEGRPDRAVWTDDYSNLWSVFQWRAARLCSIQPASTDSTIRAPDE